MKIPKNKLYTIITIATISLGIFVALLATLGFKDSTTSSLADPPVHSEVVSDTDNTETELAEEENSAGNPLYQTQAQMANPPGKVVYLTFDDGPCQYTEQLLHILDKYNVKVTFFVTNQAAPYKNMIGEAHRKGHTIAMHSYSHRFQDIYANEDAYYEDLNKIQSICVEQTGVKPTIVRFPGGTSNSVSKKYCTGIMTTLSKSLPAKGYLYCDWNVDSGDALNGATKESVAAQVIGDIQAISQPVVLLHDTYSFTVEAMEEVLIWGLSNGYTFLPLTEDSPMPHHNVMN